MQENYRNFILLLGSTEKFLTFKIKKNTRCPFYNV